MALFVKKNFRDRAHDKLCWQFQDDPPDVAPGVCRSCGSVGKWPEHLSIIHTGDRAVPGWPFCRYNISDLCAWCGFIDLRPDFDRIKGLMKSPVIFDGRNQYDAERLKQRGFEYHCIGKRG